MGMPYITDHARAAPDGSIVAYFVNPIVQNDTISFLERHNIMVKTMARRHDLIAAISAQQPELIILAIDVQREAGLDLIRDVRGRCTAPLFVLADGNRDEIDRIVALEMGADGYLTQPFNWHELVARVRLAIWRRNLDPLPPKWLHNRRYCFAGWVFDERARQLRNPAGISVSLTKSEFNLLSAFVRAPHRTLSRDHLLRATRVHENAGDRSIDVQVLRLRRKLEPDKRSTKLIRTERGCGYVFDAEAKLISPQESRLAVSSRTTPNRRFLEMGFQPYP